MTHRPTTQALARSLFVVLPLVVAHSARAALDTATERRYGGVYSNACGDRNALTAKFYGDVRWPRSASRTIAASTT